MKAQIMTQVKFAPKYALLAVVATSLSVSVPVVAT